MTGLELRYFILKPKGISAHAIASRRAMAAYAESILGENPQLAKELSEWVQRENADAEAIRRRYDV